MGNLLLIKSNEASEQICISENSHFSINNENIDDIKVSYQVSGQS